MERDTTINTRGAVSPWLVAISLGVLLGALILGVGGRLAMRGITLWEDRPRLLSFAGSLTVVLFGTGFGAVAGVVRAAIAILLPARLTLRRQAAIFGIFCLGAAVVGLTPVTVHRLALFLPVIALFALAMELAWRRTVRQPLRTPSLRTS